jgi:hypothetical protein
MEVALKRSAVTPKKKIDMEKVDRHLDEQLSNDKEPENIIPPTVEEVVEQDEETQSVDTETTDEKNENVKGELEDFD